MVLKICLSLFPFDHQNIKPSYSNPLQILLKVTKCFVQQLVHDKELAAEDEQVFLMKQQVRMEEWK